MKYIKWLGQLFQGNMGYSYRTKGAVLPMITERLGPTLLITVTSVVLALYIAITILVDIIYGVMDSRIRYR